MLVAGSRCQGQGKTETARRFRKGDFDVRLGRVPTCLSYQLYMAGLYILADTWCNESSCMLLTEYSSVYGWLSVEACRPTTVHAPSRVKRAIQTGITTLVESLARLCPIISSILQGSPSTQIKHICVYTHPRAGIGIFASWGDMM
jgi:hypothetical protein